MPKRRKKRSIRESGADGSPSKLIIFAPASRLTRTEITAGFTFSTTSAKLGMRCVLSAAWTEEKRGSWTCTPEPASAAPAARLEMVARSTMRRAERTRRG